MEGGNINEPIGIENFGVGFAHVFFFFSNVVFQTTSVLKLSSMHLYSTAGWAQ